MIIELDLRSKVEYRRHDRDHWKLQGKRRNVHDSTNDVFASPRKQAVANTDGDGRISPFMTPYSVAISLAVISTITLNLPLKHHSSLIDDIGDVLLLDQFYASQPAERLTRVRTRRVLFAFPAAIPPNSLALYSVVSQSVHAMVLFMDLFYEKNVIFTSIGKNLLPTRGNIRIP